MAIKGRPVHHTTVTLLLLMAFLQSIVGQTLTPYPTNFPPSFQDPGEDLHSLLRLRSLEPPPVFRYQPPPSGFLKPHEVAQGLQQQKGRLVLENPPPSLSKLKSGEFNDHLESAREALASELTPSIAHIFKPLLSRRIGYATEDKEEKKLDGISTKVNPIEVQDSKKVRTRKNVKEDQLPLETSLASTEDYQVPSADIINQHIPLKPNAADHLTSFRLVDQSDDNQIPPSLVTSPFAEPPELRNRPSVTLDTITTNPLIPKETVYPTFESESETSYTPSARFNSPVFNRQPITSPQGQNPPVYQPTEATFTHNEEPTTYPIKEPAEGIITSVEQNPVRYPTQSSDGSFATLTTQNAGTYSAVLSAEEQIAISPQNLGPAEVSVEPATYSNTENKYTTFTSFPSTEKNDRPANLITTEKVTGDSTFTGHSPASVEGKPLTYAPTGTQVTPIQSTAAPSASPGEISGDHSPTGHSHLLGENKQLSYSSTISQETPTQPTAVSATSPGTPVPVTTSTHGVSSAIPYVPNSVLRGVTGHFRPIHTPTPLVTPFNPYTTLFQPQLGFGNGLTKSYNIPLFNLGLGGNSYFK